MTDSTKQPNRRPSAPPRPGPARLVALLAGSGLAVLGVLGFFYDSSFGTGSQLASDDLAGILFVNGWRNIVYLATGLLALALAPRFPRLTALGLGAFYLAFGLWGLAETDRGIGSILDTLPLGDNDNALHLIIGGTGLIAALVDGPLPSLPKRKRREKQSGKPSKDAKTKATKSSKSSKPAKPAKSSKATAAAKPSKSSKLAKPAKATKPATASGGRRRSPASPRAGDDAAPQ